jgi:pyruvate/oxaloacetate carboxyltransferase
MPKTTIVLQKYASIDSSSRNTLDHDDFLGGHITKLKMQVKHQKAANDEAKANLVLHDVIRCHKDIGDGPLELLTNVKKVLEKCKEEATDTINNNLMVC